MEEHDLAKVGVAGSNPVSRSIILGRRSQVAKAEVCKTSIHRFDSDRRLRQAITCRGGEIGRRKGLKIPRVFISVPVQLRPSALMSS